MIFTVQYLFLVLSLNVYMAFNGYILAREFKIIIKFVRKKICMDKRKKKQSIRLNTKFLRYHFQIMKLYDVENIIVGSFLKTLCY